MKNALRSVVLLSCLALAACTTATSPDTEAASASDLSSVALPTLRSVTGALGKEQFRVPCYENDLMVFQVLGFWPMGTKDFVIDALYPHAMLSEQAVIEAPGGDIDLGMAAFPFEAPGFWSTEATERPGEFLRIAPSGPGADALTTPGGARVVFQATASGLVASGWYRGRERSFTCKVYASAGETGTATFERTL